MLPGLLPAATVGPYLHLAARSVLGETLPPYSLAIWHGVNAPLVMSLIALAAGAGRVEAGREVEVVRRGGAPA